MEFFGVGPQWKEQSETEQDGVVASSNSIIREALREVKVRG
jgi:hypothetical protein